MHTFVKRMMIGLALALGLALSALPVHAANPAGLPEIDHPFFDLSTIQSLCQHKVPEGMKVAFYSYMDSQPDATGLDYLVREHDDPEMIDLIDPATGLEVELYCSMVDAKRFELNSLTVLRTETDGYRRAIELWYEYPKKSKAPVLREANLEASYDDWSDAHDQMSACKHNYRMDAASVNELVATFTNDPEMLLVDESCRPTEPVQPYLAPEALASLSATYELDPLPPEMVDRVIEVIDDDETLGLLLKKLKIPEGMSEFKMTSYIKEDKDSAYSSITLLHRKLGLQIKVSSFKAVESGKPFDGIMTITRQVDPKNCFASVIIFKSPDSLISHGESVAFEGAGYVDTEKDDDSLFRKAFFQHEIYVYSDWRAYTRSVLTSAYGLLVDGKFNPDYVTVHP